MSQAGEGEGERHNQHFSLRAPDSTGMYRDHPRHELRASIPDAVHTAVRRCTLQAMNVVGGRVGTAAEGDRKQNRE
jgi:hypothetical protein